MAYISTEDVKAIRVALKERFGKQGFKFSVRREHYSSVYVSIMQSPVKFLPVPKDHFMYEHERECYNYHVRSHEAGHGQLNHFHLNYYQNEKILKDILAIIKTAPARKWYDNSDSMTDYFDTAFYITLQVGKEDKPCVYIEEEA